VFQTWRDLLHRLRSYCWETARRSIRPNFPRAPCKKKYALDQKWSPHFWWSLRLYHRAKLGEDRTTRASCRCENVMFMFAKRHCQYYIFLQAKIRAFRPTGATHCTDSRQTWHGRQASGSARLCIISPRSAQAGGNPAQNIKNFYFLVKSRLDRFLKFWGLLYA